MFDRIKAMAGDLSQDPTFANADYNARLKILANNRVLDTIAKQVFSSWQAKHAQLVKTKGGPLAPQEAKQQVAALVKQTMLPPYTELDNLVNGQQIQKTIDGFVAQFNAGNMDRAEQAMGTLAELGAAAVTTRQAQGATAAGAQQRPAAAAAPAAAGAQAQAVAAQPGTAPSQGITPDELRTLLKQPNLGITGPPTAQQQTILRQLFSNMNANLTPRSTLDAHADSLLRLFGFDPQ